MERNQADALSACEAEENAGSEETFEWHIPERGASRGRNMFLLELGHAKSRIYLGPEHELLFSDTYSAAGMPGKSGVDGAPNPPGEKTIDIALLPSFQSQSGVPGVPTANGAPDDEQRALGASPTCVTYAVKPGVARVVCVVDQEAQPNPTCYRVQLPDPPEGCKTPRIAAGLSLCPEKLRFLLTRDQYGMVAVYKRRANTEAESGTDALVSTDSEETSTKDFKDATLFIRLQLDLGKGQLTDARWMPPMPQRREGAGDGTLVEEERTQGGCYFVTVQQHKVAVWSLPLLRSLIVTLRRHPGEDCISAEEAEATECCCCVLPLEEAASAAKGPSCDPFSVDRNVGPPTVRSVCFAPKEGCLLVGMADRTVSAWRLHVDRNGVQRARLQAVVRLPASPSQDCLAADAAPSREVRHQQGHLPSSVKTNPFFPSTGLLDAETAVIDQQQRLLQEEQHQRQPLKDSDEPYQLLLLYTRSDASGADSPFLVVASKGALYLQLFPLYVVSLSQQQQELLGPCQQTLCFDTLKALPSDSESSCTSSDRNGDARAWASTDPFQRYLTVGVVQGSRSYLCAFDSHQPRTEQQRQQGQPLLHFVLLLRLDLPLLRLGATVVTGTATAGEQQPVSPGDGSALYCYCIFKTDQQLQRRELLRLHYIDCNVFNAEKGDLEWQRLTRPLAAQVEPAGEAGAAAPEADEAVKACAATDVGDTLKGAHVTESPTAAAGEADPVLAEAPTPEAAAAASTFIDEAAPSPRLLGRSIDAPSKECCGTSASPSAAFGPAAAAVSSPVGTETPTSPTAVDVAGAAAPSVPADPAILLAVSGPPSKLHDAEVVPAAPSETLGLGANGLVQLLFGRFKGHSTSSRSGSGECAAASDSELKNQQPLSIASEATKVGPKSSSKPISAVAEGSAAESGRVAAAVGGSPRGTSPKASRRTSPARALSAAAAAGAEGKKPETPTADRCKQPGGAALGDAATPTAQARSRPELVAAAGPTGGRRRGRQQHAQAAGASPAAPLVASGPAADEAVVASTAAGVAKSTGAQPAAGGTAATAKFQEKKFQGRAKEAGVAVGTDAEAAGDAASGAQTVSLEAVEALIAKATGEITQKISVTGNAIVKASNASGSERQQQQRLAAFVAGEVQKVFSSQLQAAVQEACEAARVAALGSPTAPLTVAFTAAQHQNLLQQLKTSFSDLLQQHMNNACKVYEEQQQRQCNQTRQLLQALQQNIQKSQQYLVQQIQDVNNRVQTLSAQGQQQHQQLMQLLQQLHKRQSDLEETLTSRFNTVESNLRTQQEVLLKNFGITGTSLNELRVQLQEACEAVKKQETNQEQHQELVLHQLLLQQQQQQLLVEQVTQAAVHGADSEPLNPSRGSSVALHPGGVHSVSEVSGRPSGNDRETSAQFKRRLNAAVEEQRYDDAFGIAISADLQRDTRGLWVSYLCNIVDPAQLFDMDPPPLGHAALLGVIKVLSEALASEAIKSDARTLEKKALWVTEALMQLNSPSKQIPTVDFLDLLEEYKVHLLYAQNRILNRFQNECPVLDERLSVSLKQLKRLTRVMEAVFPVATA